MTPFVVITGLCSSGSSCLAGVLWHLGIYLGDKLGGSWGSKPGGKCGYEAKALSRMCERIIPFLTTEIAVPENTAYHLLKEWVSQTRQNAAPFGGIPGGKYPQLCRLGELLMDICGESLRLVVADRDIEESIESLIRRTKRQNDRDKIRRYQEWLAEGRDEFASRMPEEHVCRVLYDDLLLDPYPEIERLVDRLGLGVTDMQRDNAARSVRPEMRHVAPKRDRQWA